MDWNSENLCWSGVIAYQRWQAQNQAVATPLHVCLCRCLPEACRQPGTARPALQESRLSSAAHLSQSDDALGLREAVLEAVRKARRRKERFISPLC